MDLIEHPDLYYARMAEKQRQREIALAKLQFQVEHPAEHPDGWDRAVINFFLSQPNVIVHFMKPVNILIKQCRAKTKAEKEKAKRLIIHTITRLLRAGRLKRVGRHRIRINAAEVPSPPIIPLEEFRRLKLQSEAHGSGGNAGGGTVILGGIFV